MILRTLNLVVIVALIFAAAYVYRIKFNSTVQAEHLAKMRSEVRRERDGIAALRAELGQLDAPARIEDLAKRFLKLKPVVPTQFNTLDNLPPRAPQDAQGGNKDPLARLIENLEPPDSVTGSIPAGPPPAGANTVRAVATVPADPPPGDPVDGVGAGTDSAESPADSGAANP